MTTRRAIGSLGIWCVAGMMAGMLMISPAQARDAAFVQPGAANTGGDEAVRVEPKSEIDVGDTIIHATRRTTLFFINESNAPVQVEKMAVNSDANIETTITNDDCSKEGSIAPQSRCSVEVSVTPSSSGPWSAEVLMTHNGAGRIARVKLSGKTAGNGAGDEKKESGLAVSSFKEATTVDFGVVEVGGKAARSALMVNDSPDAISLYSIDVIEADNGLKVLDGGCAVDMELKPGESCPVTIVWEPADEGQVSTDLIIRHSGRKGFAVVPVRGKTKGYGAAEDTPKTSDKGSSTPIVTKSGLPSPPTADELDRQMAGKISPVAAEALAAKSQGSHTLHLIGTVGNRALLLLPDGTTRVADLDDEIPLGDDKIAKVTAVDAKSVKVMIDGKEKKLVLEADSDLVAKAVAAQDKASASSSSKSSDSKSSAQKASSSSTPLPGAASKGASP